MMGVQYFLRLFSTLWSILLTQGPIQKKLRIGDFEKLSFFESAILDFFFQKNFFCFIPMKISQSYLGIKDGLKFWWLPWFTAKE